MKALRDYLEDQKLGESLRRLGTLPEFRSLKEVLRQMYVDSLEKLADREDPDARSRAKFIDDLMSKIDTKIKLGAEAARAIQEERFEKPSEE